MFMESEEVGKSGRDVGDLLRLKRAEHPDDAFWDHFQDDLRREIVRRMVETVPRRRWVAIALGTLSGAWPVISGSVAAMIALVSLGILADPESRDRSWVSEDLAADRGQQRVVAEMPIHVAETRFVVEVLESGVSPGDPDAGAALGQSDGFRFEQSTDYGAMDLEFVTDTFSSGAAKVSSGSEAAFFAN